MTVEDAFKRIRRIGGELETINILYVTDPTRHLLGVLSVRDLLLAEEDDLIEEIMDPDVVWAKTTDDKEDVAQALSKYDFLAMPIVDLENGWWVSSPLTTLWTSSRRRPRRTSKRWRLCCPRTSRTSVPAFSPPGRPACPG